eukprot:5009067-Prymnesium_polylepis.2
MRRPTRMVNGPVRAPPSRRVSSSQPCLSNMYGAIAGIVITIDQLKRVGGKLTKVSARRQAHDGQRKAAGAAAAAADCDGKAVLTSSGLYCGMACGYATRSGFRTLSKLVLGPLPILPPEPLHLPAQRPACSASVVRPRVTGCQAAVPAWRQLAAASHMSDERRARGCRFTPYGRESNKMQGN